MSKPVAFGLPAICDDPPMSLISSGARVRLAVANRPLVGATLGAVRGRRIPHELHRTVADQPWNITLGWSTEIDDASRLGGTPAEAIAAAGMDVPEALFLEGRQVDPDERWSVLSADRRRYEHRVLVGAPFVDSLHIDEGDGRPLAKSGYDAFRSNEALELTNPSYVPPHPHCLREFQLMRWRSRRFFADRVATFEESGTGWGDGPVPAGLVENTYQSLYYTSLLVEAVGGDANVTINEIGGGFGNLARTIALAEPGLCAQHTIVDLPSMTKLQQWFLDREFPGMVAAGNSLGDQRFRTLDAEYLDRLPPADVMVATHSLTELDPRLVNDYLVAVLRCRVFVVVMGRQLFSTKITYDWMLRRLLDEGFVISRIDALETRNVVAVVFAAPV
jgi:hypothetical protein